MILFCIYSVVGALRANQHGAMAVVVRGEVVPGAVVADKVENIERLLPGMVKSWRGFSRPSA